MNRHKRRRLNRDTAEWGLEETSGRAGGNRISEELTSEHEGGEEEIDLEGQNSERTEGGKVATWSVLVEYKSEEEVRDTMR